MGTEDIFHGRILKFGRHFELVEKKIQFLHARYWPFTREHARAYGAIFSKNRFFGTIHEDKPTSQNGISLRSPSLIMAPGSN